MEKKLIRRKPQKYSRELKLQACQEVLSGRLTVTAANEEYDIRSASAISRWVYQLGLKGKHKEREAGIRVRYSKEFKIQVCLLVSTGRLSISDACKEFGIPSHNSIATWLKKYKIDRGEINLRQLSTFDSMKKTTDIMRLEGSELQKRIDYLENILEDLLLESEANAKIIEVASRELNINIRKKFNTK